MKRVHAGGRAGISLLKDRTGAADPKGLVILLVSVVLAAACAAGVYFYLKNVPQAQAAPEDKLVPVVVATQDMTFGTKLGPEHVKVVRFPAEAIPKGSYSVTDSVLAQSTRVFVMEGEPILASKLSAVGGGLSLMIPEQMRAISLSVNEITGVNGFVLPGDRVDVLVTVDNVNGSNLSVTKTVLQNVEVLASGSKTETKRDHQITVQAITLLVDPKGAEALALGLHQGQVHLILRNPVDQKIVESRPTDTRQVLSLKAESKSVRAPQPAPPKEEPKPEPPPSFTIIRNGTITTQTQPETKSSETKK
jgi:pilus assembly protein CpaB